MQMFSLPTQHSQTYRPVQHKTPRFEGRYGRPPSPAPSINPRMTPKEASTAIGKLWNNVVQAIKANRAPNIEENAEYKAVRSRYDRNREKARPILENQPEPRSHFEPVTTHQTIVQTKPTNRTDRWAQLGEARKNF